MAQIIGGNVISESNPLRTVSPAPAAVNYEFKARGYADLAAYQTDLATQTAAGWEPVATARLAGVTEALIVTYRRRV